MHWVSLEYNYNRVRSLTRHLPKVENGKLPLSRKVKSSNSIFLGGRLNESCLLMRAAN